MKANELEQKEAIKGLKEKIQPGDDIYTIVRHVSPSGMTRWIDVYCIYTRQEPESGRWNKATKQYEAARPELCWIGASIAKAIGYKYDYKKHQGIEMGGCGMDMTEAVVMELSRALFGDSYLLNNRYIGR